MFRLIILGAKRRPVNEIVIVIRVLISCQGDSIVFVQVCIVWVRVKAE